MKKPLNFYTVFNPMLNTGSFYQTQAHEFYFQLKQRVKQSDSEQAFLYWGKLKLNETNDSNYEDFEKVLQLNKELGVDTNLFITDYHHFWVAKVESVQASLNDSSHTLPFYDDKDVSVWFKIVDMDLVSAEFEETSHYLSQLYVDNEIESKKIDMISPYVGGLKFPLVVQDKNTENYFRNLYSEDPKRILRDNALIENPVDSENVATQVKSFVLPPHIFSKLSHQMRNEILSIETMFSKTKTDDKQLFEGILYRYLRILESTMNETLGVILKREFGETLYVNECGTMLSDTNSDSGILLKKFDKNLSIELFVDLFHHNKIFGNLSFEDVKQRNLELVVYFQSELQPFISKNELIQKRRSFQVGEEGILVKKELALHVRNTILGVGCIGVINKLVTFAFFTDNQSKFGNAA